VIDVQGATLSVFATFDRPMLQSGGTGAVTVAGNYQLDGQPLPARSTILCSTPQCTLVRIELPTLLTPGAHTLRLVDLVSQAGALLDPNPTVRTFQTRT